ncbi:MAG: hypothetical protein ACK2UY_03250 [Anaerolineae bacterium]
MIHKNRVQSTLATMAIILALSLAACGGEPTAAPTASATARPRPAQTQLIATPGPQPVSPLPTPVSPLPTPTTAAAAPSPSPTPPPAPGATATRAAPTAPPPSAAGTLTPYLGVNQVLDLAFDPETGALWAATTGGAARWDLAAGTYVQYTAGDGPASNYVTGVAVAPAAGPAAGVWFATGAGVSHFDGATWTTYPMSDGQGGGQGNGTLPLPSAGTPQAVAVAADGTVWVGTTDGVSRYDPATGTWTGYLAGGRAWDVAVATDGSVWFAGHGNGLHRYDPAADAWTTYNQAPGDGAPDGRPLQGITTVVAAPDGSVWAYENYDGVYRFDGDRVEKVIDQANRVCDVAFQAAANAPAGDGTPWLATCGSLRSSYGQLFRRAESGGWAQVEGWHPLGRPAIEALAFAPDGETLALGTSLGIAVRQDDAWRLLRGGPSRNWVTAAAVAPDGGRHSGAWFGFGTDSTASGGGGASRFDPASGEWSYALGDLNVRVLAVAPDGALWAGTGCSVQRLDAAGGDWQTVAECGELGNGNVLDFAFGPGDGRGDDVWVATGMNLARRHEGAWEVFDRLVHSVAVAADGTVWASGWLGTQGDQDVARFDGSGWTSTSDRGLSALTATTDGALWAVEGELGLVRFDGQAWQPIPGPGGEMAYGRLAPGPDGALWAARPFPARYEDGAWTSYPPVEGIQALAVAGDGSLWLATTTGIVQLAPDR